MKRLYGIKKVTSGFYKSMETNTVYYDPYTITVSGMENVLKRAGTYIRTLEK